MTSILNDEIEIQKFLDQDKLTALYIYADWCNPCKKYGPVFDECATNHNNVNFIKAKVEDASQIVTDNNVVSVPTVLLFKSGKLTDKIVGSRSLEELNDILNKA